MTGPSFQLREFVSESAIRIVLIGELDFATVPALRHALLAAVQTGGSPRVDVDLAEVTFLDCAAIGAFVGAYNAACARGVTLRVVRPTGWPLRLLRLTGVYDLLGAARTRQTARVPASR